MDDKRRTWSTWPNPLMRSFKCILVEILIYKIEEIIIIADSFDPKISD